MFLMFSKKKAFLIFPETENPKNLLIFQEVTCKARKTKKSVLNKFLVSSDVFAIIASVEHIEILCKAKNKTYNVNN